MSCTFACIDEYGFVEIEEEWWTKNINNDTRKRWTKKKESWDILKRVSCQLILFATKNANQKF